MKMASRLRKLSVSALLAKNYFPLIQIVLFIPFVQLKLLRFLFQLEMSCDTLECTGKAHHMES